MFECQVEQTSNHTSICKLAGRLDAVSSAGLKDKLKGMASEGAIHLVLDLAQVEFIDSSGLTAIVSGFKAVREKNGGLVLATVGNQARVALRLTKLDQILPIFDDVGSALAHFGSQGPA